MYPYHRGPSRLLWFIIGAATATWWIRRKETDRRIFGHCMRPPVQSYPSDLSSNPHPQARPAPSWPQNVNDIPRAIVNIPQSPAPSGTYSPTPIGEWERRQDAQWELEKEHLVRISRQAADAMADLTESTLESVLSTAETLKVKLAERRAQRERQLRIAEEVERQRQDPPQPL